MRNNGFYNGINMASRNMKHLKAYGIVYKYYQRAAASSIKINVL